MQADYSDILGFQLTLRNMSLLFNERFSKTYKDVELLKGNGLYNFFRSFESNQQTEVVVGGKKVLMFGSNSYLGLTTHPQVIEAATKAIEKYGSSCSGSRFLNGTTDMHEELENRMARFLKKEDALIFSTGFQVNLGSIPAITQKGDSILLDRYNHASIYEGARLSEADTVVFRHNDMNSLEKKLQKLEDSSLRLIIVDGVFSMEGDIVNLPEINRLAKKYNAAVMTDCAHAIGVLGDQGRGTPDYFGLTNEVSLIGGTFSKSFASLGGFIAGNKEVISHIKHNARSLIFSASMTPAATASALAALDIIESDDSHRLKLWDNTNHALEQLRAAGFDTGHAETPIVPIYIRDNDKVYALTSRLMELGLFVNAVVAPAVPPSESMIRFSLMSTHSFSQIDQAIDLIAKASKELGIPLAKKAA